MDITSSGARCCAFRYVLPSWLLVHAGLYFPLSGLSFYFRGAVRYDRECIIMYMRSCIIMYMSMYMRFMHHHGNHITRPQRCANAGIWSSSATIATI